MSTKFKVGWKGGPGRPKLPEDIKEFRRQIGANFAGILCELLTQNQGKLHQIHCSPDASTLELIIARFLQRAINEGDVQRFSILLDRFIGVIPKTVLPPKDDDDEERNVTPTQIDKDLLLKLMLKLKTLPEDEPCKLVSDL